MAIVLLAVVSGLAAPIRGQRLPDLDLADHRPEAWALQYYTSLGLPTGFGPPVPLEPWSSALALEVDEIPWLSEDERRVGFNGTKVEDLNHAPVLIRPKLLVGLPNGWSASIAYVPPVKAFDIRTDLYGVAIQRAFHTEGPWQFGLRAFAQYARVRGAFTCSQEVVDTGMDPVRNPFGCEAVSHDTVRMRVAGLEASVAYRFDRLHGLTPFASVSWQDLDMDFEVDAHRSGFHDHRYLKAETRSATFSAGARLPVGSRWEFAAALLHAPIDVQRPGQTRPRSEPVTAVRTQLTYFFDARM